MKFKLLLTLCLALSPLATRAVESSSKPPLYSFQNGIRSMTPEDGVRLLKELGYEGVGSVYPKDTPRFKEACEKEGIKLFSIYAGGKVNADSYHIDDHVVRAIESLKGTDALIELNVQRGVNPNDEQAIAFVRDIADKAKAAGLRVVLYPHANFHIERFDHAVRIAKATERDNVGVTFNLCHFLKVQPTDDLTAALLGAKSWLWSASTCGADADGKEWGTLIRPLDEGTFDQASLLRNLREIGFQGPVGLQCFNIKIDSRQHLERSRKAWNQLTSSAAILPR